MNELQITKGIGLLSVLVGGVQIFAGRRLTRHLGLGIPYAFIRYVSGPRALINGFVTLAHPDKPGPLATRVAGDALDLALLGNALRPGNARRSEAALAMIAILGLTILDVSAATALARRESRALATARRTRVKQILT